MLEALEHPLWTPAVRVFLRFQVQGHFARVLCKLEHASAQPCVTLFHVTHQSWWDGHLMLCLALQQNLEFRALMLERELRKYGFLRYAGGFGFVPGQAASVREMMRYAQTELARTPPRALVIFPAGEIVPSGLRPLPYQMGVASMALQAAKAGVPLQVRAVAIRLEHRALGKPEALLRVGAATLVEASVPVRELHESLRQALTVQANALQEEWLCTATHATPTGYSSLLAGLPNAQQGWDALRQRFGGLPSAEENA